ncbi:MAG: FAD-binding oxidoreductase, partial [Paracoccaceae bacterium]|nr:FAD-binding oxidoreductase [Paracoccaceae bacterium]
MASPLYRNESPGQLPKSWYVATVDMPPERPPLYGHKTVDVCIIGAGFTGLSAAKHLAQKGLDVVVLDAHRVGFGASGRNGGQVCTGFNMSQRLLAQKYGKDQAAALWALSQEAKDDIRRICATDVPDARFTSGVAEAGCTAAEVEKYHRDAAYLNDTYGYDLVTQLDAAEMQALVKTPQYQGGILDMGAGHIHPLRYVLALARLAEAAGAQIFERAEVHHIEQGDPAEVRTDKGRVKARHVILAGNGYLPNIVPKVSAKIMPLNSFIAATEPLGDRAAEILARDIAVSDSKFVLNYYRLSEDKRLLFGGRPSYRLGFPKDVKTVLAARMVEMFPQLQGVGIDYTWGGTLGITVNRLPSIQRIAPNIVSLPPKVPLRTAV